MKIEHVAIWVNDLEGMRDFYKLYFGGEEKVNELTSTLREAGYAVLNGPRTTGD
ncbi:VOC family protein, partial [Bacillus sp. B-TM1]